MVGGQQEVGWGSLGWRERVGGLGEGAGGRGEVEGRRWEGVGR